MKDIRIGAFKSWNDIQRSLSFTERALLYVFATLLLVSVLGLLGMLNDTILVSVPAPGGSIVEGVVGAPRFINPVLAFSDADRDLTLLTYTGLMRATSEGKLVPDLAESFSISDDGLTYTFTLKEEALFHDGERVTAEDVVFTIELAQNSAVRSPKRANWEGVHVAAIDEQTIQFSLAQVYAPFLENTTMGILPKHRWEEVPPEQILFSTYNTEPVGSGPFEVTDIETNNAGVPTKYTLKRFDAYTLGAPYLETIHMQFYPNEEELLEAFSRGNIGNINSISPERFADLVTDDATIHTTSLPRVFGVFLNQDEAPIFTSQSVREALSIGVDRNKIVEEVLVGYGTAATGPLPPELTQALFDAYTPTTDMGDADYETANALLEDAGWVLDETTNIRTKEVDDVITELRFSLATSNAAELKRVAELLREEWRKLGVVVELDFYETGTLNQEVIRPREYDALLFGQIIGRDLDPFAFWHSSQRDDPGLNIALYANIDADSALENIRSTFNDNDLAVHYQDFEAEVVADTPAVFLYAPEFVYITEKALKGVGQGTITTPAERFLNVHEWHIFTHDVWPIFVEQ